MDYLTELYCDIDDCCQYYQAQIKQHLLELKSNKQTRNRACKISISEIITILILFHQIKYKNFKNYYNFYFNRLLHKDFPNLPSYNRFIELVPRAIFAMCGYLLSLFGKCTGVSYIDSTPLKVCHNKRIS